MQKMELATIVGRSRGEKDMYIVLNENTGITFSLVNANNLELEIGAEGSVEFDALSAQIISFEPVLTEALA